MNDRYTTNAARGPATWWHNLSPEERAVRTQQLTEGLRLYHMSLTPKERSERSRRAANIRWGHLKTPVGESMPRPAKKKPSIHAAILIAGILRPYTDEEQEGILEMTEEILDSNLVVVETEATAVMEKLDNVAQRIPKPKKRKSPTPSKAVRRADGLLVRQGNILMTNAQKKTLANNLALAIKAKFETTGELCRHIKRMTGLKMSHGSIENWIKARYNGIRLPYLNALARSLNMEEADILNRELGKVPPRQGQEEELQVGPQ